MSSMEVDIPQVNGLPELLNGSTQVQPKVHFSDSITVDETVKTTFNLRPKHKARRRLRVAVVEAAEQTATKPISPSKLKKIAEKDRHSRTGRRGLPKKGGAGGKGTWGKLVEVYDEDGHTRDSKDPNYNSEDEEMGQEQFQKQAEIIFKEYFDHGNTQEVADSLAEWNHKNYKHRFCPIREIYDGYNMDECLESFKGKVYYQIVHILITLAMEEHDTRRELASVLISDLYSHAINSRDIAHGFDLLLSQLDDLSLDTPDAPEVLGNFMARCVADDCLPPAYVNNHSESTNPNMIRALKRAKLLLSMKHGIARLDNVWGMGGGQRPVMFLISKMNLLLKEFLSSGDYNEAMRCLRELEVPHFHHELVYEAVVLVLEEGGDRCVDMMSSLLQHMAQTTIITSDQFKQGFMRVFDDMTDIVLDVPNAYHTLTKLMERGVKAGFVSASVAEQVPQRGRKRFVSEGDGGRVKSPED